MRQLSDAGHRLTLLCYGAMMTLAVGLNLLPVFLSSLSATFGGTRGLSGEQLGRLGGLAFLGLVIGIVITGPLADRFGAKIFAQAGNVLTAICLVLMAVAPSYALLAGALMLLGFAAGMLDMVLSPVVSALNPDRRAEAMNWLHSFYCLGAAVTILVGMVALKLGWGWRVACFGLAPIPLGLVFAFAPLRFPEMHSEAVGRTPVRELAANSWFRWALVGIFLGGATELGMAQWLPAYAETTLGFPAWMSGGALLAFSIAMALGRMVVGSLGARWDPFGLMAVGGGLSIALFLLGAFLPNPNAALLACIAAGFAGSALWPTMLAVTADRFPQGGATMFGALAAFGNAGGIVMPWSVGLIADRATLHWGLASSAMAPLAMIFVVLWLRRRRARVD